VTAIIVHDEMMFTMPC